MLLAFSFEDDVYVAKSVHNLKRWMLDETEDFIGSVVCKSFWAIMSPSLRVV